MKHSFGEHENFMLDPKMNPCIPVMCALELSTDEAAEFVSDRFSVWLNTEGTRGKSHAERSPGERIFAMDEIVKRAVERAIETMQENLGERLTIDDMARSA